MARINDQRTVPVVLFAIALALVGARVASHFIKPDAPKATGVQWVSLEEATRMAAMSPKPLLLDFTADWCAPCHVLDAEVFANPELAAAINDRFIPVRIVDRRREEGKNAPIVDALQQRYSVRGFPTVVIAGGNGEERARMEGFRGRDEFRKVMESVR